MFLRLCSMQLNVCKQAKERWGIAKVMTGARESKPSFPINVGLLQFYWTTGYNRKRRYV